MSVSRQQLGHDALTEFLVDLYYLRMMGATTEPERRRWCDLMTSCCRRRSPERVRQMEIKRGLVKVS